MGEKEGQKRRHAVAWKEICKPKWEGGIGIKSLSSMNDAFMAKLVWRMLHDPNELWVQVLNGKYGRGRAERGASVAKMSDSRLWKEIVKMWDNIRINTDWEHEQVVWKLSKNGKFTISSMYKWIS